MIGGVHKILAGNPGQLLPRGLNGEIIYDSTEFVNAAIYEVILSLVEALVIVTLVVFLFLGSVRSSIIPTVAIPLSLVGTLIILLALGYSINLLTLLALVLAIGLVVDDAIIVVENVNRHLEEGVAPVPAAIAAARELGGPIIAMTVVLAAVYVPIGFQSGLTGALFAEFAFALVGAVTVSGIVALTLSPMLCSRLLKPPDPRASRLGGETHLFHRPRLRAAARRLRAAPARQPQLSAGDAGVCADRAGQHLLPVHHRQDRARAAGGPGRHHHAIDRGAECDAAAAPALFAARCIKIFAEHPETDHVFQLDMPGQSIAGMVFKPWDQRARTHQQAAAGGAAGAGQGRGRARRRLPAAAAAGQLRPADPVRHRHHRAVRAA